MAKTKKTGSKSKSSVSITDRKQRKRQFKVLFVASECAPYAKSGGLADVVGALPKTLRRMGHDARIILPLYSFIDRERFSIEEHSSCCVHMGQQVEHWVGIFKAMLDGEVPVYFVDFQAYYDRGIYDAPDGEYQDNAYRFSMLSKAAIQFCKDSGFIPDVMHVHDWPTACTPMFLKTWDRILSPMSTTASVLTIHNIGYQGVYSADVFPYLGVGDEFFVPDILENFGRVNLLKAGIHFADAITTVSPTHAREIMEPVGGQGLAPYVGRRADDVFGILNGVDYDHWNPETDTLIPAQFSRTDLAGKALCKQELQRRMNLYVDERVPLFGMVSRFATQKGFNLLQEALPEVLNNMHIQFAVLGTGNPHIEHFMHWLGQQYPGRASSYVGFDVELSHWIEAGSDFFLMPSLYEPCGLNQIYSMKYGTLPVVRATGGLEDTVVNYNEQTGEGTGFKFFDPKAEALYNTIGWAVSTWYDRPDDIALLRDQAMQQHFSWDQAAREYLQVYDHAVSRRLHRH
jgi:starch synthase